MVSEAVLNAAPEDELIRNTKWYHEDVCCNGDSEHRADFRFEDEACEGREENECG